MNATPAVDILNFWFGNPADPDSDYGQQRRIWFQKQAAFDQQVRQQFLASYEQARQGTYQNWRQTPQGTLALVILFDQFPRHMFRGTPQSFATDALALSTAQSAIAQGSDRPLLPVERLFLYLPFEHSENLEHQNQSVALFEALVQQAPDLQSTLDYAYRHREVIARFGRFPHRNAILGRDSTAAELAFLQQPGSRF
ncbi:DUF924 family protein [Almyronema epifaneia]|uniref:DUF924 family protein n=1 Tax=Almyronema epifaneia S1 TaxID=2991925 RepID=A0ABW6IJG4_9CYAN